MRPPAPSLDGFVPRRPRRATRRPGVAGLRARVGELPSSDADLLDGIRAEDDGAFKALFDRYHADLRAFAASIAGDNPAGDVVQDVFVEVWTRRHRIEADPSLRAYLFRATRNRALNARRGRRRWALRFAGLDAACHAAAPPLGDGGELARAVASAVARLPERQRAAFRLRHEHGLSYAEVAAAMEISPRTVEVHLAKATRAVRDAVPPELLRP